MQYIYKMQHITTAPSREWYKNENVIKRESHQIFLEEPISKICNLGLVMINLILIVNIWEINDINND